MCISYKCLLDKPQVTGSDPTSKSRYQISEDCTYWPVLGSFNKWNTIQFTNKTKTSKGFYAVHKFLLVDISDNMYALVNNGKYGAINTENPTTIGYYVVRFLSEPYTLQDGKKLQASHKCR